MSEPASSAKQAEELAHWLHEVGLNTEQFIDVHDGGKGSTDHTRGSPEAVSGNYGIYAGDGLVIVDVDDYDAETDDEALAAVNELPETLTAETPHTDGRTGGHRFYAVAPGEEFETAGEALEAVTGNTKSASPSWGDLKVGNGYVVGPGSSLSVDGCDVPWCDDCDGCDKDWCEECATPDGGRYSIAADRPIATITADDLADLLRADPQYQDGCGPDEQATLVANGGAYTESPAAAPGGNASETGSNTASTNLSDEELLDRARNAKNGAKFDRLWRGDTSEYPSHSEARFALLDLLAFWTGGDRGRMDRLFRQSGLYPHPEKAGKWERVGDDEIDKVLAGCTDFYELDTKRRNGSHDPNGEMPDGGDDRPSETDWEYVRALFDSDDNGSSTRAYNVAADALLTDESLVCVRETGEFYRYDPERGYYRRKGESYIRERLRTTIPEHVNNTRMKNIIERVRDRCYLDHAEFTPPEGKVVVANGVLDLDTRELEPFTSDYYFTAGLACRFDPDATADEWTTTLRGVVPHDGARATLQEFAGYCLVGWHHKREKNLFVVGPRRSGKSTFVDTLAALFGDAPTVTNLTPQQLADTRFDRSALMEATLNARNDINATKIEDSGTLKTIFSGEPVKMERKNQDAEFAAPTTKHLFSANWVPRVVGEDESFYRRVLLVEFPEAIPREKRDLDLKERLREHELPGILNWALDGRDRLNEQGSFTRDRDLMDTRLAWLSWRAAPLRFLFKRCEITGNSDDTIERKSAYRAYKEWAGSNGYGIRPQQSMTNYWKQVPHVEVTTANKMDVYAGVQFAAGGTDTGDAPRHSNLGDY